MAWLKYYSDENARHPAMNAAKVTVEQARQLMDRLFQASGLPAIPVKFTVGKEWAWYRGGQNERVSVTRHITLDTGWMNVLTVIHEFCHYAHHWDRMDRMDAICKRYGRMAGDYDWYGSNKFMDEIRAITRERRHGSHHRNLVDFYVALTLANGWVPTPNNPQTIPTPAEIPAAASLNPGFVAPPVTPAFIPPPVGVVDPTEVYAKLAPLLECPKCGQIKSKEMFGVRTTKKDAFGRPTKVIRQSYCKPCRNS